MLSVSWIVPIMVFILGKFLQVPLAVKLLFNLAVFTLCYAVVFVSYLAIVIYLVKQNKKRKEMTTSFSTVNARLEMRVSFTLADRDHSFHCLLVSVVYRLRCQCIQTAGQVVRIRAHVDQDPGSVKLRHELSYLWFKNTPFWRHVRRDFTKGFQLCGDLKSPRDGRTEGSAQEESWPAPRKNFETHL